MAMCKVIESKAGHTNSYWNIGELYLHLSQKTINVILYGYKNKWGRTYKEKDATMEFTFPADPDHKDLKPYQELILDYVNQDKCILNTSFKLKVDWKVNVTPDINKLVKYVLEAMYNAVKQTEQFKGATDI